MDSPAKELLDAATLPWRSLAEGNAPIANGTIVAQARVEGPRVTYNPEWVGWKNIENRYDGLRMHAPDAALIVYAVNRLPDYEAAVDLLEPAIEYIEHYVNANEAMSDGFDVQWCADARAALARLRSEVTT